MLDQTDRRMLRLLQSEGRITNHELATRCNMSPAASHERFKRLKEKGVIQGFAALIDPEKVDRSLLVFVEVLLHRTTGDVFGQFAAAILRAPEVMECHMVAGGFDYLVKVRVQDMKAYRAFLGTTLAELPGVRETRTYAVLEQIKSSVQIPL